MLSVDARELPIADPVEGKEIVLKAVDGEEGSLADAKNVALIGKAFDTDDETQAAAQRWRDVLRKAFASANVGADFGDRAAGGFFFAEGLKWLAGDSGDRFLNDAHGIMVYECEPEPRFARAGPVQARAGPNEEKIVGAIAAARALRVSMSAAEALAYDLYAASFSESSADARFMLLMMAVETLIDTRPREDRIREHVDSLIAATRRSELPDPEVASIVGSLGWLRDESIGQAGRRLAAKLGDRRYMDEQESAVQFFTECYQLRSTLVHGHEPRPSRDRVGTRAATLERFVADLLSLDFDQPS